MEKVLVTGGAGFIGSHLCRKLLASGYGVTCLDNLLTGSSKNIEQMLNDTNFNYIKHDMTQPLHALEKQLADVKYIFHLASPASPNHHSTLSYHALPLDTMLVNTQGTLHLLELAEKNRAKFLFASSSEVYGDPLEHPQKESYRGNVSSTGPRSVYDEAKRFGETFVSYFRRERGVDGRIVRIFNTYGPGMLKDDMRMIIIFILQALTHKPITIFGNGEQTRSLCYVTDTVAGIYKLMFSEKAKNEIVNIGSEEEHTVLEYARMIKKLTQSESEIVLSEALPEDDPLRRRADITKAKMLLDWKPEVSLESGLQQMIAYVRKI